MSTFVQFETFQRVACDADPKIPTMYDIPMLYQFSKEMCEWIDDELFPGYIAQYMSEDTYSESAAHPNNAIMGAKLMVRLDREQTAEVYRRFSGIAEALIDEDVRANTKEYLVLAGDELATDDQKWETYVSLMKSLSEI